jgi:hypothetical protein
MPHQLAEVPKRTVGNGRDALVSITEEAHRWHERIAAEVAPDDLAITRRVLRVLIALSE